MFIKRVGSYIVVFRDLFLELYIIEIDLIFCYFYLYFIKFILILLLIV